jgi:ribonuclease-3
LVALSERIGYDFFDLGLLRQAMAHRSYCAEHPGNTSNERLEFLGDAVLGWVVADLAYRHHKSLDEGKLTDLRKAVVNADALAELAEALDVGSTLLLGKGEAAAGGRRKRSILSDALEAVIGAVYLDGGPLAAHDIVSRHFGERVADLATLLVGIDHKTALQELVARLYEASPTYVLTEDGPDHAKRFRAEVLVEGETLGLGEGRSKKQAEQAAARAARARLAERVPAEVPAPAGDA